MIEALPLLIQPGGGTGARIASSIVSHTPIVIGDCDNLSQSLTIGGVSYDPTAYLVADDIPVGTGIWPSRHDISKVVSVSGSGTAPTYGVPTANSNTAVKYAGAKYHKAADTTWGQITTGDGAISLLMRMNDGFVAGMCASGSTAGFRLNCSSGILYMLMGDGTNFINVAANGAAPNDSWIYFFIGIDKSDKAYFFVNGVYFGVSGSTAAITTSLGPALSVGAFTGGESPSTAAVSHLGVWNLGANVWPGAGTNQAVMGAIAAERFAVISGISCNKSTVYSFARASAAYLDRYTTASVRTPFLVSAGWPRVCQRLGSTGVAEYGYLSEPQGHNDFLYSSDFSQAGSWPVTRCTVGSNAVAAPDGTTTADSIIASSLDNTHYVEQSVSAAATEHIFSVWAKSGAKTWLELSAPSVSQAYAYFNLGGGVVGSKGSGAATSGIQDWGGGWYRCWFTYTGGAASHAHRIGPAEADNDDTFAGDDATASIYVWGAQHEDEGTVIPSSLVPTTTAAATRIKDALTRTVSGMTTGKFSLSARVLTGPSHNNTQAKQIAGLSYDDDNRMNLSVTTSDTPNFAVVAAASTTADITGTTDMTDGAGWRDVRGTAQATRVTLSVDGTGEGTPDTSAAMPTAPTTLRIGCSLAALTGQPLALIREIKVQKDII